MIRGQIEKLKNPAGKAGAHDDMGMFGEEENQPTAAKTAEDPRLKHLEQLVQETNERLKAIESRLPPKP